MTLTVGQTLSQYEILAPLGAGGMGEVWRARDTRLAREVAIKVLPAGVAADPDRLRRFEREARALASLSHPHVAQVYGIDEVGGTAFMAMELVPGEDLSARLSRGALPLDEALDVCRQIAEGLEAAHEAGVVHRDLKPANVKLTPGGHVKLLDFGLAKAVGPQPDSGEVSRAETDSALLTEEGLVLGTPVYMSPEQARGRSIDRRTDLWSLGCVLYECLTGRRPFAGRNPSDIIASILKDEPDWSALPPVPPRVAELLRRCLTKDARMRLRDAGEARVQLVLAAGEPLAAPSSSPATGAAGGSPLRAALFGVAGLAVGVALGLVLSSGDDAATAPAAGRGAPGPRRLRYALTTFDEPTNLGSLELSPAADAVAWVDEEGLQVRRLDEFTARRLPVGDAIERSSQLCWSPDGRELTWIQDGTLWRMPVDGVEPIRVSDVDKDKDGGVLHWGADGRLIIAQNASFVARSAAGKISEVLYSGGDDAEFHFDGATLLPDGHGILVLPHEDGDRETVERIVDGERRILAHYEGWDMLGLKWADDRLFLLTTSNAVSRWWWVDCPPDAEGPLGEPRPTAFNSAAADFGPGGTVVWVVQEGQPESQLARVGPDGTLSTMGRRHEGMLIPAPEIADGRRLLFSLVEPSGSESSIWAHDLVRGADTFVVKLERMSPVVVALENGDFITSTFMPTGAELHRSTAVGEPEPLDVDGLVLHARPDGRQVLISNPKGSGNGPKSWDDLGDDAPPVVLRESAPIWAPDARFSPDGRWLVFVGNDSGESQAFLSAVPPDGREWQVSIDGADLAWFVPTGDAILLEHGGREMGDTLTVRRVSFLPGPEPELGLPELLHTFEGENLALIGSIPDSEDLYGIVFHPPVTHEIAIETGWVPDDK